MGSDGHAPTPMDHEHTRPEGLTTTPWARWASSARRRRPSNAHAPHVHLAPTHRHRGLRTRQRRRTLRKAGYHEWADRIEREPIGRDVLDGRWTFQVMEEYDDGYYAILSRPSPRPGMGFQVDAGISMKWSKIRQRSSKHSPLVGVCVIPGGCGRLVVSRGFR